MATIEIERLTMKSSGTALLKEVTLQVEAGETLGLFGANGSGKSLLCQAIAGQLAPSSGQVVVAGMDVTANPRRIRGLLGYLPQQPQFYESLTVRECLDFVAGAFGMRARKRSGAVSDVLELTGMTPHSDTATERLSPGLSQRAALARALIHNPDIVLLDDPVSRLDPEAVAGFLRIVKTLQAMGKTIVLAGNRPDELGGLCRRVAWLSSGRLTAWGTPDELLAAATPPRTLRCTVIGDAAGLVQLLTNQNDVARVEHYESEVQAQLHCDDAHVAALLGQAILAGAQMLTWVVEAPPLSAILAAHHPKEAET